MTSDVSKQVDAFVTPGTMLRCARMEQELSAREVADRLNMMPGYVEILERDDYAALRSPAFARGYVKAYGHMLGLNETELLQAFDELRDSRAEEQTRVETSSLQLQSTGVGMIVGLAVLLLLFVGLWLWQGRTETVSGEDLTPAVLSVEELPAGEE